VTLRDNLFGSMRGRAGDASNVGPPIQPPGMEAIDVIELPATVRGDKPVTLSPDEEYRRDCYGPLHGFVYVIAVGDPTTHVKIGYTRHQPAARLKALQTGNPLPMRLMGAVRGNENFEREYHQILAVERCAGEWFTFTPYVARVVADMLA